MNQAIPHGQSHFLKDSLLTVISSTGARLITLIAMAAITRIYAPEDYGIWVLVFAFAGFFMPLTTLRYEIALVLAAGRPLARRLFWVMLISSCAVAVLTSLMVALPGAQFLSRLSGLPVQSTRWLLWVPVLVVMLAWQQLLQSWLMRDKNLMAINLALLANSIVTAAVVVVLGWLYGSNPAFAVYGGLIGQLANLLRLGYAARRTVWDVLRAPPGWRSMARAMQFYRVYPIYSLPYSISIGFTERALQVSMAALYSVPFLGTYYVARQLLLAPAQIVSAALRNVLLSHGARHDDLDETRPYVLGMIGLYIAACAPLLATGAMWLVPLVNVVLGNRWAGISDMAYWCMWPGAILMLTGSVDRLFDLAGRQRLAVILQLCSDAITILILVCAYYFALGGMTMIALISLAQAVYNLIWLVIVLRVIAVPLHHIAMFFGRFLLIFAGVLAMQYGVSLIGNSPILPWVGLIAGLGISAIMLLFLRQQRHGNITLQQPIADVSTR